MSKRIIYFLACIAFSSSTSAQNKQTVSVQQVWLGYFNQARFSDRWGMWSDFHLRTRDHFFTNFFQAAARVGLTYYVNDDTRITAGYAYFHHLPAESHKHIARPEHRPWQQVQWQTKYKSVSTTQWFRFEQRYRRRIANDSTLDDGYNFNFRMRYNFQLLVPLGKGAGPKNWSFTVNDEVHVNFGKEIVNNYFDQNRFFVGLNYQVSKSSLFRFGYMNLFQQMPAGNLYRMSHVARIYFMQHVDLRKKPVRH